MAGYSAPQSVENWSSFSFIQAFPPMSRHIEADDVRQSVEGTDAPSGMYLPTQSSGSWYCFYRLLSFVAPAPLIIDRVVFQHSVGVIGSINARIAILRFAAGTEAFGSSVTPFPWSKVVAGPSPIGDTNYLGIGTGFGSPGTINAAGTYNHCADGYTYEMAITSDNYNQLDAGDGLYLFLNSPVDFEESEISRIRVTMKGRYVAS
ncbi:MAG: hypothetical protein U0573_15245 [Phycisphaerales bacterium]|nr:hypothetical protein [Planctomycetota bacterium]